jgi:FkbM family methyltransferase
MSKQNLECILQKYSAVNTHMGTDKITSHSYGTVYSNLFEMYRHTNSILEVGFDGGASLLAYAEYFADAKIYGIDIEDNRLNPVKQHPRIQTFIGDATLESTVNHFSQTYDIIIEDASHTLNHQVQHFHDYAKFVRPGGLYIIEDVAEINKDSLEEHLASYAKQEGFDMYIYDLRPIKNRFDDILFIFQKKTEKSFLCDRFVDKLKNSDIHLLKSFESDIQTLLQQTKWSTPIDTSVFFQWFYKANEREAKIFFTLMYERTEWRYFCELYVYPKLLNVSFFSTKEFPLEAYKELVQPSIPSHFKRVSLDVGMAFNGPNTSEWVKNPEMFILGFEPNPTNLRYLHMPFEERKPPANYPYDAPQYWLDSRFIGKQVQIFPFALSNETGQTDFYCTTNDPGTSSMYKPTRFGLEAKVIVPKHTLSSVLVNFPWHTIPFIDHLKIDAQGHDFEILLGALSYLDRIAYINIEMSVEGQYEDVQNKFPLMNILLQSQGFRPYNMEGGNCSYFNTKRIDYCNTFKPQFIDL